MNRFLYILAVCLSTALPHALMAEVLEDVNGLPVSKHDSGYQINLTSDHTAGVYSLGPSFSTGQIDFQLGSAFAGTLYACQVDDADTNDDDVIDTAAGCVTLLSLSADATLDGKLGKRFLVLDIDTAETSGNTSRLTIRGTNDQASIGGGSTPGLTGTTATMETVSHIAGLDQMTGLFASTPPPTVFYIDPYLGDDTNACTEANPCRSLAWAKFLIRQPFTRVKIVNSERRVFSPLTIEADPASDIGALQVGEEITYNTAGDSAKVLDVYSNASEAAHILVLQTIDGAQIDTGTTTAGADGDTLVDSGATWSGSVSVGDCVINSTRNSRAVVEVVTSNTELEITPALTGQTSGDTYEIVGCQDVAGSTSDIAGVQSGASVDLSAGSGGTVVNTLLGTPLFSSTMTASTTTSLIKDTGTDLTAQGIRAGDCVINTSVVDSGTGALRPRFAFAQNVVDADTLNLTTTITDQSSGDSYSVYRACPQELTVLPTLAEEPLMAGHECDVVSLLETQFASGPRATINCNRDSLGGTYGTQAIFGTAGAGVGVVGFQNIDAHACRTDGGSQHQSSRAIVFNSQIRTFSDSFQTNVNTCTTHNDGALWCINVEGRNQPIADTGGGAIAATSNGADVNPTSFMGCLNCNVTQDMSQMNAASFASGPVQGDGGSVLIANSAMLCSGTLSGDSCRNRATSKTDSDRFSAVHTVFDGVNASGNSQALAFSDAGGDFAIDLFNVTTQPVERPIMFEPGGSATNDITLTGRNLRLQCDSTCDGVIYELTSDAEDLIDIQGLYSPATSWRIQNASQATLAAAQAAATDGSHIFQSNSAETSDEFDALRGLQCIAGQDCFQSTLATGWTVNVEEMASCPLRGVVPGEIRTLRGGSGTNIGDAGSEESGSSLWGTLVWGEDDWG